MSDIPRFDRPKQVTPETLDRLDELRAGYVANAFEIEWFNPEVSVLEGKRILVTPSGPFWTPSVERPEDHPAGNRAGIIKKAIEVIERDCFVFGGEQLGRAIISQTEYDAWHRRR